MTIRQIAEQLGVAPSTVSVVLNDRPGIRPEMREKIRKVLQENGYRIRTKEPETNGNILLIYFKSTDYLSGRKDGTLSSILSGLKETTEKHQYTFSITNADAGTIDSIIRDESGKSIGIILLCTEYYENPTPAMTEAAIPLIMLDGYFPEYPLNTVNMDNSYGISQLVDHLVSHGHKKIGYLKSRMEFGCLRDRTNRIYDSLRHHGIEAPFCIINVSQEPASIQQEIRAYLDAGPDLPSAFIADNDAIAVSAMQVFQNAGYKVPENISITGFDDSEIGKIITPNLTTVQADLTEMARQAVLRIITMHEEGSKTFTRINIGTCMIERDSVSQI